ncbi:uncharacterized protein LOC115450077 [Manduca sexta]|uniref:uncharacterized protein LOC115450077 n=1 Tax=Manduca sexta TaxID=7130 RepID=UPI00188E7A1A|nr:uncharacterized protein LOC115450077 [Manduca sexta]XP_030034016.2 uncharacterized protein LOC115450077 [Manduca sexta]XP_030034087.2 uncharacterized protein LOC115450077 [Manduca sexta]
MILPDNINGCTSQERDVLDGSINLDSLYCSHLWTNSGLRNALISAPFKDNTVIKYCYTCKNKIRKYEIQSPIESFIPNIHSTPNGRVLVESIEPCTTEQEKGSVNNEYRERIGSRGRCYEENSANTSVEIKQCIPSISQQLDYTFRQKYISHDTEAHEIPPRRLRRNLKGIGCVINFVLTDSPVKKRTQIQACSISVMIVAIVVISFVLVNFTTPDFTRTNNVISTMVVPINNVSLNSTTPKVYSLNEDVTLRTEFDLKEYTSTIEYFKEFVTENKTLNSNIILKIRKNIRTYPKHSRKDEPKDIINRDLSHRFCSCQKDEICMLDESSGKSVCRQSADIDDPTGCGGLCALETEACQLVDKKLGVRVCRLLTLATCSPLEWRCRNGLCISADARCDGTIQCYDRSDEVQCECDLTKQFRCGHSISCFPNSKLCDGIIDCWDGFDEVNCTTACPEDKFTCTDGQCIMSTRFCDGFADCADGSDEPHGCEGACGVHEIRCKNQRCVSRAVLCDGHDDCGDASDEINCSQ